MRLFLFACTFALLQLTALRLADAQADEASRLINDEEYIMVSVP